MGLTIFLFIVLAIVAMIYFGIGSEPIKKTSPKEDAIQFASHMSRAMLHFGMLMYWGILWIADVFRELIKWYRTKPQK